MCDVGVSSSYTTVKIWIWPMMMVRYLSTTSSWPLHATWFSRGYKSRFESTDHGPTHDLSFLPSCRSSHALLESWRLQEDLWHIFKPHRSPDTWFRRSQIQKIKMIRLFEKYLYNLKKRILTMLLLLLLSYIWMLKICECYASVPLERRVVNVQTRGECVCAK